MNTFLPYPDFKKSAKCLDNKRLGKQRVETLQIYNALKKGAYSECPKCLGSGFWSQGGTCESDDYCPKCDGSRKVRTGWYNHPIVQMWKGYESALLCYGFFVSYEWKHRGFKDTMIDKFIKEIKHYQFIDMPPWLGNKKFHLAMRSNLLRKDKKHYSQFGWEEKDNLPYVWYK